MRHVCSEAAAALQAEGIGVELIDLRSLWPWDREMVMASLRKTGRLLVAQEAVKTAGLGAEIAAECTELMWRDLKAAPVRLGGPRAPTPFSQPLEVLHRVSAAQVADAARALVHR